jgi:DNA-binding MarR family transcriptional regulator
MVRTEDHDHLANLLGVLLTSVGDELSHALEREVGIGGAGPAALLAVDTWSGCSIEFLSGVLGRTHSGTVRMVDRLEDQGLVERRPGPDGRTAALCLTKAGRRLARRARDARYRLLSEVVDALSASEQRSLGAALDRALRRGPRSRIQAQRACRLCDHSVCRGSDCPVGASVDAD